MESVITTEIAKLGFAGMIIMVLGLVVKKLWSDLTAKDARIEALQEKRLAEAREGFKALEANTTALERIAEVVRERKA